MSERQIAELRQRSAELCEDFDRAVNEAHEINQRYGAGNQENWPTGQRTRWENLTRRTDKLKDEIGDIADRIERIQHVTETAQRAARAGRGLEPGDGHQGGPTLVTRNHARPWDGLDDHIRGDTPTGIRTRALDACEVVPDMATDARKRAAELIEADQSGEAARWALAAGDPAYVRAFAALVADPQRGHLMWSPEEHQAFRRAEYFSRALNEGSGSAGAYMVPFQLDPTILLSSDGSMSPMRRVCRVVQITTDTWHGVSSAGVTAEWLAEGTEAADASPTLAQPSIPVFKGSAWVPFSYEVQQDAASFTNELGRLLADSADQLQAAAYVNGSGSGQPTGITTALPAGSKVAAATADTLVAADVVGLQNALPPRFQARAQWLANLTTINTIASMETTAGALRFPEVANNMLLRRPLNEASFLDAPGDTAAAGNDNVAVYGDTSQFVIVDRIGTQVELIPHVFGANQRPTGQRGMFLWFRTGSDVTVDNAFRLLTA